MHRLLAIPLLALALAGCGSGATYSSAEVVDAFGRHGFELAPPALPPGTVAPRGGELLAPRSGEPFVVVVGVSSRADAAWDDYKAQQRRDTFDSQDPFDVRRGNVLAISDGGLSRFDRARIVDAMSSLPDRGAEVDVAGRV